MKPVVVIGLLGTTLDSGKGSRRWERWRPTVSLCQHDDFVVDRFELIHGRAFGRLAERIVEDIGSVSPETVVRKHVVSMEDPWDFEEVYGKLHDFARGYPFDPEREEYLVHITTGSHVAQICNFLLTESGYMGKPIGNGHPLAAVVTTREIAESFCNGMEYFNTFGGNPVSCRVGIAVLDVIEEEGLRENALETGAYLMERLWGLGEKYEAIGDVRGLGLFLGVDVVKDRGTREEDRALARGVVEYVKGEGVLLSTDGPGDNVLKFKPPIGFGRAHADVFVSALDRAFGELV